MSKFFFIEQRKIFQALNSIYRSFFRIFVRLKSACYEFYCRRIEKKKRYNNINVSIAKILVLVVKEEDLFLFFFFIPYIGPERILIRRDALSDSQSKPDDFYYFPTSYPLCFPLCFLSLCFFMIILLDISPDSIRTSSNRSKFIEF